MSETTPQQEGIDLEKLFASAVPTYVLRMRGTSMIDDHLCDGDFVVIERRETATNGDAAVVLLDTGECTLRRYFQEGDTVRLKAANKSFSDRVIEAAHCKVQGVVIGVLRDYRR